MGSVAGIWTFSHLGPSPISEGAEELQKIGTENMKGAKISIGRDGNASMLVAGNAGAIRLEILEETPIYIKLGAVEIENQAPLSYDKSSRLLALPINVDTGGSTKLIPAYFKRR